MTTIALSIPEPSAAGLVAFVLSYSMARRPVRAPAPESFGFGDPKTTRTYFHQIPDETHV
jgi:hypothetical protein